MILDLLSLSPNSTSDFQVKPRILRAGDFPSLRERLKQVRNKVEANVLISTHGEYLLLRLETEE